MVPPTVWSTPGAAAAAIRHGPGRSRVPQIRPAVLIERAVLLGVRDRISVMPWSMTTPWSARACAVEPEESAFAATPRIDRCCDIGVAGYGQVDRSSDNKVEIEDALRSKEGDHLSVG